jgi:hypothetical protein
VAEQSVIVNNSVTSGNTSGGTQVMERPQQVNGAGGTVTSAESTRSVSGATSAESAKSASGTTSTTSAESASAATSAGSGKAYARSGGLEMEPRAIPFAAVSFVSGLVGLLVANLVLGPLAIILGLIGLRADSNRRVRAALGIFLGAADIVVFVLLAAHAGAHHGSLSWSFLSH